MAAGDHLDQVTSSLRRLNTNVSYSAFPRPPTAKSTNAASHHEHLVPSSPYRLQHHHHHHHHHHQQQQQQQHYSPSLRPDVPRAQTSQQFLSPTTSINYTSISSGQYSPPPRIETFKPFPRLEDNELLIMYQSEDRKASLPENQRLTSQPRQLSSSSSSPRDSARSPLAAEHPRPQSSATSAPRRRTSNASSNTSVSSPLHPPPSKPLPPVPQPPRSSYRISSNDSYEDRTPNSLDVLRFSQSSSSGRGSLSDVASVNSIHSIRQHASTMSRPAAPEPEARRTSYAQRSFSSSADRNSTVSSVNSVTIRPSRLLDGGTEKSKKKGSGSAVYYLDLSSNNLTLASKHGNNLIRFWSVHDGTMHASIKFSSYTDAQSRSRDYLIRSHAILSEGSSLVAIAVKFGRTVEIWNWTAKKCLQSLDGADRWVAGRFEFTENDWSQIALYHNQGEVLELYSAARGKKPFAKSRTIELKRAGLPFVPQYPELAISPTSPILVAAAGPRPPRMGNPPPDREVILVAWDISESGGPESHTPWRVNRPQRHPELETAIPSDLVTYENTVASIWIPATFRTVANSKGNGYNLVSVPVRHKLVLVWDLVVNTTRIHRIPNTTACVSPDCRYVAFCDVSGGLSARGTLSIMDLATGAEVWSWPDKEAGEKSSAMKRDGYEQLDHLGRVTELSFSVDSKILVIGDSEGKSGMYELRGSGSEDDRMELYAV